MKSKPLAEINGVVLTEKATDELKVLQDHSNEVLTQNRLALAKVITYLATHDSEPSEDDNIKDMITDISFVSRTFERLIKP